MTPRAPEAATLRIIHVVFSLASGGMENGVVNLANQLNPAELSTAIICLNEPGSFVDRLRDGIPLVALGRKSGFSWRHVRDLASALRRFAGERTLIHTHNLGPLIYAALAKASSLSRFPILHGEHAELHGEELSFRRRLQQRVFFRAAKRLHTVSQSVKRQLVGLGMDPAKISVILNGVDCQRFHPPASRADAKASAGMPANAFVLGYVARFAPSKRHALLLEAFEQAAREMPNLHLLLAGDGGPAKSSVLEAIARHPFQSRIHWKGYQDQPQFVYQAMDLFVMPSLREGLANVLLESMASGVPPVAHDACGAIEVIDHGRNGLIESMGSAADLSQCLIDLIPATQRLQAMSREARLTAERSFSLSAMVDGYSELYRSLAPPTFS